MSGNLILGENENRTDNNDIYNTDPDIPTTKVSQSNLEISDSEKSSSLKNSKVIISLPRHPRGIDPHQDTLQHLSRYSVIVSLQSDFYVSGAET